MLKGTRLAGVSLVLAIVSGCTLNSPFDPANIGGGVSNFFDRVTNAVDNTIADPLDQHPYPVLVGGNSDQILYATNLGDVRINFPGPTGEVIIPGFVGPSNVYKINGTERSLIGPLVPTGDFGGLATDGETIAFISAGDLMTSADDKLIASAGLGIGAETLFDASQASVHLGGIIAVDDGRVAFDVFDDSAGSAAIRVVDLTRDVPELEISAGNSVLPFAMKGGRLAYFAWNGQTTTLNLRELATDATTIVSSEVRDNATEIHVFLTDNAVVWNESATPDGSSRVFAYDISTGQTRTWVDAVSGTLTGAADSAFLTEEYVTGSNGGDRIVVRLYDANGKEKKLADFRADGLAGQSAILGDRAVWVNPARRIVVAPLAGGDRREFKPF